MFNIIGENLARKVGLFPTMKTFRLGIFSNYYMGECYSKRGYAPEELKNIFLDKMHRVALNLGWRLCNSTSRSYMFKNHEGYCFLHPMELSGCIKVADENGKRVDMLENFYSNLIAEVDDNLRIKATPILTNDVFDIPPTDVLRYYRKQHDVFKQILRNFFKNRKLTQNLMFKLYLCQKNGKLKTTRTSGCCSEKCYGPIGEAFSLATFPAILKWDIKNILSEAFWDEIDYILEELQQEGYIKMEG